MRNIFNRYASVALSVAAAVSFSACSSDDGPDRGGNGGDDDPPVEFAAKQTHTEFALNLLEKVASDAGADENVVISPLSLSLSLSMTANGAKENTLREMMGAVYGSDMTYGDMNARCAAQIAELSNGTNVEFNVANSLWTESGSRVYADFMDRVRNAFSAEVREVDNLGSSSTREEINRWVAEATKGNIPQLLDRNLSGKGAAIVNALRMHAVWEVPFDSGKTGDGVFTASSGVKADVRMMHDPRRLGRYADAGGYEYLVLDICGDDANENRYALEIILPAEGETPASVLPVFRQGRPSVKSYFVDLRMPRFTAEYGSGNLAGVLKALGIRDAFDPSRSDFSAMSPSASYIDQIIQKSNVSVDEKGVSASAATLVDVAYGRFDEVSMSVDRPFIFMITNMTTRDVLFSGIINRL